MENVLRYKAVFARFQPQLPPGWRYVCKLSTYAEKLYQHMKNIVEKSWRSTWSEEHLNAILKNDYLLPLITIEVLNNIISESKLLGGELHINSEITD